MVSVICLSYNHEKFLCQALDSILKQKVNFRYEIIICNDASTDNTGKIIKEYKERYPDLINEISNTSRLGGAASAYKSVTSARGKYLASCEGDDFWIDETKLAKQVDFMESNPDYIGCVHDVLLVDVDGEKRKGQKLTWVSRKKIFKPKHFKGIFMPGHASTMLRKNLFLKPGFNGHFILEADKNIADRTNVMLWLEQGNFFRMKGKMSAYRYVRNDNGKNLTSVIYLKKNSIAYDYEYTLRLEKYAKQNMDINMRFWYHKMELFAKAIMKRMLNPKTADKEIIAKIFKNAESKILYLLSVPYFVIRAIYFKVQKRG